MTKMERRAHTKTKPLQAASLSPLTRIPKAGACHSEDPSVPGLLTTAEAAVEAFGDKGDDALVLAAGTPSFYE